MFRADRLMERRKHHKLTQEQLARAINLTKAAISNYEQGRSAPPHETLAALVDALHTNADYLLGISDSPEAHQSSNDKVPVIGETRTRYDSNPDKRPEDGVFIAYLGGPPEEMDEEEAEHLRRELEMFRAFKEKRRLEKERQDHS